MNGKYFLSQCDIVIDCNCGNEFEETMYETLENFECPSCGETHLVDLIDLR